MNAPLNLRYEPRAWQQVALRQWLEERRGVVEVVTGGGKTVFAQMCIIEMLRQTPDLKVAIVVPTVTLLDQWLLALQDESGAAESDIACYSGEEKPDRPRRINILVINTARSVLPDLARNHKMMLVVDECHRAGSPQNAKVLQGKYTAALGLSATPNREYDDGFDRYIRPALGEIVFSYDYRQAHEDKVICDFSLTNVSVPMQKHETEEYEKYTKRIRREMGRLKATGEGGGSDKLKRLLQQRAAVSSNALMRIPTAVRLAENHRNNRTLIFHETIKGATKIFEMLQSRKHTATLYHSGISAVIRRDNLRMYKRGLVDVLVCCRALDEGMNVPETAVAIIAAATASSRQRIQRLGRVLRPSKGKSEAAVYTLYASESERLRLECQQASNFDQRQASKIDQGPGGYLRFLNR